MKSRAIKTQFAENVGLFSDLGGEIIEFSTCTNKNIK